MVAARGSTGERQEVPAKSRVTWRRNTPGLSRSFGNAGRQAVDLCRCFELRQSQHQAERAGPRRSRREAGAPGVSGLGRQQRARHSLWGRQLRVHDPGSLRKARRLGPGARAPGRVRRARDPSDGRRRALLGQRGALDRCLLVGVRHLLQPRFADAPQSRYPDELERSRRAAALRDRGPGRSEQERLGSQSIRDGHPAADEPPRLRAPRPGRDPDHGQREGSERRMGPRHALAYVASAATRATSPTRRRRFRSTWRWGTLP